MELSLVEIWQSMGFMARFVAVSLLGMGFLSLFVVFERLLVLIRTDRESLLFAARVRPLLDAGEAAPLRTLARSYPKNPLARITALGIDTYEANLESKDPIELTRRELVRKLEVFSAEARRGMGMLASIGSTAPFIGLFGTVIGIITAFQGIAAAGGGGSSSGSGSGSSSTAKSFTSGSSNTSTSFSLLRSSANQALKRMR